MRCIHRLIRCVSACLCSSSTSWWRVTCIARSSLAMSCGGWLAEGSAPPTLPATATARATAANPLLIARPRNAARAGPPASGSGFQGSATRVACRADSSRVPTVSLLGCLRRRYARAGSVRCGWPRRQPDRRQGAVAAASEPSHGLLPFDISAVFRQKLTSYREGERSDAGQRMPDLRLGPGRRRAPLRARRVLGRRRGNGVIATATRSGLRPGARRGPRQGRARSPRRSTLGVQRSTARFRPPPGRAAGR